MSSMKTEDRVTLVISAVLSNGNGSYSEEELAASEYKVSYPKEIMASDEVLNSVETLAAKQARIVLLNFRSDNKIVSEEPEPEE